MPIVTDIHSISDELALSTRLVFLMSKKSENFYNDFFIKKKDGTNRQILSPKFSMKMVQKWILSEILEKVSVSEQAMAYIKGQGSCIKKNANYHRYNLYIYEIDLKDFFTAIKRVRVFYVFKNIGYNKMVSNIFANLCTYKGYLPQGGVCSPALSNIICKDLDKRLYTLCSNRDITYTRYSDDLTFSCDNKLSILKVIDVVNEIVKEEGFSINPTKTRLLSPSSHKTVTGITVNDAIIKVSKTYKRQIRSKIHFMICSMDYSQLYQVRGMISYVSSIEIDYHDKIKRYITSFYSKKIAFLEDVVSEYNRNKIFPDMDDMLLLKAKLPVLKYLAYDEKAISEIEHKEFLTKHGLIKDTGRTSEIDDFSPF